MSVERPKGWEQQFCSFPMIRNQYFGPQLNIQTADITTWSRDAHRDAIVSLGNEQMLIGGGFCDAIHNAAGPELRNALLALPEVQPGIRCPFGEAKITPGYKLPAAYVIHAVESIYGPDVSPEQSLRTVYRSCLSLARENNIQYVAFPANISCSTSSFPVEEAATVAFSTVQEFAGDFQQVCFIFPFHDPSYKVWLNKGMQMFG